MTLPEFGVPLSHRIVAVNVSEWPNSRVSAEAVNNVVVAESILRGSRNCVWPKNERRFALRGDLRVLNV